MTAIRALALVAIVAHGAIVAFAASIATIPALAADRIVKTQ